MLPGRVYNRKMLEQAGSLIRRGRHAVVRMAGHFCASSSLVMAVCLAFCASAGLPLRAQTQTSASEQFRLATEAMAGGHLDEAANGFAAVVRAMPSFAEAHFNLGLVLEEQGKHEQAIASLQKALALKPRLRGANLFLGLAEFRRNHVAESIVALKKETAAYPKDAGAWMWLGVAQLANNAPEDAARSLDRAAKLDPRNVDILYHRGQAHLLASKESYTEMFKVDPKSWRVHQVLAQTSAEAERHEESIVEYLEAIKLAPTQPGLHEELGTQYRSLGKMDEADAAFRRELELDPYNVLAKYKLGVLQVEKGNAAQGKKLIEAALQEKSNLLNSDYNLGRAEMALGSDAAAAQHLERATMGNSDFETVQQAWYQLGIVYRRLHRMEDAQKALATFQKLKDEEAQGLQRAMKKYTGQHEAPSAEPAPAPSKPE